MDIKELCFNEQRPLNAVLKTTFITSCNHVSITEDPWVEPLNNSDLMYSGIVTHMIYNLCVSFNAYFLVNIL